MRPLLAACLTLFAVSACTATIEPPKARIVVPAIATTSPGFCPPGQAKKGNC